MAIEDLTPNVAEVAAHLRARTKDRFSEKGTFTDETRPTKAQVEEDIPYGVRRITAKIGTEICKGDDADRQASLYEDGRDLAALATALRIERSYFPEQVGSGKSPYKEMLEEYKEAAESFVEAVADHCPGSDAADSQDAPSSPSYAFPCPSGWAEEIT